MEHTQHLYRTEDDLKNFCIRVHLSKVSHGGRMAGSNTHQQEAESYIFSWQKKAFSQREYEFYGDAYNCTSALESRYSRDIARLRQEGGRQNGRLFCYIEGDQPNIPAELCGSPNVVEPSQSEPTFASRYFSSSAIRRRRPPRKQLLAGVGDEEPVLERPTVEERLAHRVPTPPLQSMYIMADLTHSVEGIDIWEEHLLCLIQVDDGGAVSVKPDFNSGQTPYRIETRNRDVYEYRLHQVMEPVPPEHIDQEKNLQEEIYRRKAEQLHNLVGTQFADPPEGGALSVVLLGEIVSAQGFEYNDIYVTAQLQLPEFWEVSGDQELSVVTQISRTKSKHLYNVANFNCPFEYDLIYHNITTIEDDLAHWPCVLMEVCSLDSWDRHRVEGSARG
ncbi:Meckel syndrome type 1 protein [Geodia barretti]|uniref:Meckel syndrome type 1 protein n=1 Tax=Geodia barretti TaxID=519541 RepID=A0AA35XM72_GEOBA|nr:Meckel syndrome type 1 protein [Geodia barretti]